MSGVGPANINNFVDQSPITSYTVPYTILAADLDLTAKAQFNCGFCRRVYVNQAGSIYIQRINDTAMSLYTLAQPGYIDGAITKIGGTTTGTTAGTLVLEL